MQKNIVVETHDNPHLDEYAALWFIKRYAGKKFLSEYCPDGKLQLGIGGGKFDEHPRSSNGNTRKESECCTTLVVKALGLDIESEPALKNIVNYVYRSDSQTSGSPLDLAYIVKLKNREDNPGEVLEWLSEALNAKRADFKLSGDFSLQYICFLMRLNDFGYAHSYQWFKRGLEAKIGQQLYFFDAESEFKQAQIQEIELVDSEKQWQFLKMATVESDNTEIHKVALKEDCDIIVVRRSSGHVQIFTDKRRKLDLSRVARLINVFEQSELDKKIRRDDMQKMQAEGGEIPGGRWYYFPEGAMLLNGSLSELDKKSTQLDNAQIVKIIKRKICFK